MGPCSLGTAGQVYAFTSPSLLTNTLGVGEAVDAAAHGIEENGYALVCPTAITTTGDQPAFTQSGSGAEITITGDPLDAYRLRVKIITGGVRGTATFQWSVDEGRTWSKTTTSAATVALAGTGLTLAFEASPELFVANELYSSDGLGPVFDADDVTAALEASFDTDIEWGLLHLCGVVDGVSDSAKANACETIAAAVGTKMASLASARYRYARALVEAPDVADAALISAFADFIDARVMVAAGHVEFRSPLNNRVMKRSAAHAISARIAKNRIHEHPGKVRNGALTNRIVELLRDEFKTPGLDAQRFTTLTTIPGKKGAYITRGNTMADVGSDYSSIQNCRVIDKAARVGRSALLEFLNDDLFVSSTTGYLTPSQAASIDTDLVQKLQTELVGSVSALDAKVSRTDNVLSTTTLNGEFRVTPKGYAENINFSLGFTNPALTTVSA